MTYSELSVVRPVRTAFFGLVSSSWWSWPTLSPLTMIAMSSRSSSRNIYVFLSSVQHSGLPWFEKGPPCRRSSRNGWMRVVESDGRNGASRVNKEIRKGGVRGELKMKNKQTLSRFCLIASDWCVKMRPNNSPFLILLPSVWTLNLKIKIFSPLQEISSCASVRQST